MVVAASAVDRQSQHCLAGRRNDVIKVIEECQFGICWFIVPASQSVEPCGNDRFRSAIRKLVSRQLLRQKSVVWQIAVEGFDDVVAISPDEWLGSIPLITVRFRISDKIQPVTCPVLAIMR